jgi:beta-galactosidase
VTEWGALTKKYAAFRDVIKKHRPGENIPAPPTPLPTIKIPAFKLDKSASLWDSLPKPLDAERPRNMESYGQSYGYILYRTVLKSPAAGDLVLPALRSFAGVYVNRMMIGTLDRRKKQDRFSLKANAGDTLDILVEGGGRINFTVELRNERQGINGPVTIDGHEITDWQVFPLPMDDLSQLQFSSAKHATEPAFYRGTFELTAIGDTFLDMRGWGKGAVWINGHALGRFWNLGPQQTLYVPGPWLIKGKNEVVVFTQEAEVTQLRGLAQPILNKSGYAEIVQY